MVLVDYGDVDQWVLAVAVDEDVGQRVLADFALELVPIKTRVVGGDLSVLLGLEPALQAVVVDEFDTTTALADLNQGVVTIELCIPAETALSFICILLFSSIGWFALDFIFLGFLSLRGRS